MDVLKVKAIDPAQCDCPECATGEHLPLDSIKAQELFKAVLLNDMAPPVNNTQEGSLILYRMTHETVKSVQNPDFVGGTDYIIIPAGAYDPDQTAGEDPLNIVVHRIPDEHEDMQEHLINSLISGSPYTNPSFSTFIAFRNPYGHTGLIELPHTSGQEVAILPYDGED